MTTDNQDYFVSKENQKREHHHTSSRLFGTTLKRKLETIVNSEQSSSSPTVTEMVPSVSQSESVQIVVQIEKLLETDNHLKETMLANHENNTSNKKQIKNNKKQKHDKLKHTNIIPPAKENQCHFWVKRKNRYCNLNVKKGQKYCGEHKGFIMDDSQDAEPAVRVPCPYDEKHTVAVSQLEIHLARCNARPREPPLYFCKDINIQMETPSLLSDFISAPEQLQVERNTSIQDFPVTARELLKSMTKVTFDQLVKKIEDIYEKGAEKYPIHTKFSRHSSMESKLSELKNVKHAVQQSSILGNMEEKGFLSTDRTFVEFGCGKGGLATCIHSAVGDGANFVLIDRRNFKQKFDKSLKTEKTTWQRLKIDIKDLDLTEVTMDSSRKIVGVSKHLCGCATDLTIQCLGHYLKPNRNYHECINSHYSVDHIQNEEINSFDKENESEQNVSGRVYSDIEGIVIAICCHHVCQYGMYVNHDYLNQYGIDHRDFAMISTMSTWATCGEPVLKKNVVFSSNSISPNPEDTKMANSNELQKIQIQNDENDDDQQEHQVDFDEVDQYQDQQHWSGLTFEQREQFGFKCKRLLDFGRAAYLEKLGYAVELIYYCDRKHSLENVCLIATKKQRKN